MALKKRAPGPTRRSATTVYIAAGAGAGLGVWAAVSAALSQDWPVTAIAVLIISGLVGEALLVTAVLRLAARLHDMDTTLNDICARPARTDEHAGPDEDADDEDPRVRTLDLSTLGKGDPGELVAARLDRDVFPRLLATMEDQPPARGSGRQDQEPQPGDTGTGDDPRRRHVQEHDADPTALTTKNLLRTWRLGMRNNDLAACRTVFAALVDTVDAGTLEPLQMQLEELADRTEKLLREDFAARLTRRDFDGMLAVGERICRLLPDRPVTREFRRIEPHLRRRLAQDRRIETAPSRSVL
jgi:hypothetical protein